MQPKNSQSAEQLPGENSRLRSISIGQVKNMSEARDAALTKHDKDMTTIFNIKFKVGSIISAP
ncbi:MAG TPA: hypothetical protein PKW33_19240 [Anaerolineaceae bacterium]|nr:hypothetical protein [Anaerolineaceae bacterium]HPN53738.1 hypothetical protein [Anaerolineaceae bacterium]